MSAVPASLPLDDAAIAAPIRGAAPATRIELARSLCRRMDEAGCTWAFQGTSDALEAWLVADDAKECSLTHNMHVLEAQIELYRAQHLNKYPTVQNAALPQLRAALLNEA